MDKYKANFFDDNFKLNWKKFLFDEDNYEKELIYNDNAKQILLKTYLIEDFFKYDKPINEKENEILDMEKFNKDLSDIKLNESKIEITSDHTDITIDYLKSRENSKCSNLIKD